MAQPSGGGLQWSEWVTGIILEMLSHRTPPESIPANILAVDRLISPNYDSVESVSRIIFVRNCRGILVVETKTPAAAKISGAVKLLEHHSDVTSCRGAGFGNSILRIANKMDTRTLRYCPPYLPLTEEQRAELQLCSARFGKAGSCSSKSC